jgi:hypothetical protein
LTVVEYVGDDIIIIIIIAGISLVIPIQVILGKVGDSRTVINVVRDAVTICVTITRVTL